MNEILMTLLEIDLELITDIDIVTSIESWKNEDILQCSIRYGQANNPYMKEEYKSIEPILYSLYIDIIHKWGSSMSEFIPVGDFE